MGTSHRDSGAIIEKVLYYKSTEFIIIPWQTRVSGGAINKQDKNKNKFKAKMIKCSIGYCCAVYIQYGIRLGFNFHRRNGTLLVAPSGEERFIIIFAASIEVQYWH